jgi:hypothetical protein
MPKQFKAGDVRKVRGLKDKRASEIFAAITRWIEARSVKRKERWIVRACEIVELGSMGGRRKSCSGTLSKTVFCRKTRWLASLYLLALENFVKTFKLGLPQSLAVPRHLFRITRPRL